MWGRMTERGDCTTNEVAVGEDTVQSLDGPFNYVKQIHNRQYKTKTLHYIDALKAQK